MKRAKVDPSSPPLTTTVTTTRTTNASLSSTAVKKSSSTSNTNSAKPPPRAKIGTAGVVKKATKTATTGSRVASKSLVNGNTLLVFD